MLFGRLVWEAKFPGVPVGNYLISYEGLEFAERAIQKAIDYRCDMVFIEELGHLELSGKGIIESARTACQNAPNTTIVVRKTLLTAFLECFYWTNPQIEFIVKDIELGSSYPSLINK